MLRWFREWRQRTADSGIRFLVTGSIGLGNMVRRHNFADTVNDFDTIDLPPLNRSAALDLIAGLAEGEKIPLDEKHGREIIKLTGNAYPYLLQIFVAEIGDHLAFQPKAELTSKSLREIYQTRIVAGPKNQYPPAHVGPTRHGSQTERSEDRKSYPACRSQADQRLFQRPEESRHHALQAALLNPSAGWPRNQFMKICSEDSEAWLQVLPKILTYLTSPDADPELSEMAIRGLEFLLSRQAITPTQAISLIEAAGNPEFLAVILLALRSIQEQELLDKLSPEIRTVAMDFVAKIQPSPAP
jgi:hypothetical protein